MRGRYRRLELQAAVAPDLEPLTELTTQVLRARDRLHAAAARSLRVTTPSGLLQPPYNGQNVLGPVRWPSWSGALTLLVKQARAAIAA